jgi:hypothetical protein
MIINNEVALASHMARVLEHYANLVQNGKIELWRPFLSGVESVNITVTLNGGGIRIEEGPDVDGFEAEIRNLKKQVLEKDAEIKALNILLEEQKPKENVEDDRYEVDEGGEYQPFMQTPPKEDKPKRKRKQK